MVTLIVAYSLVWCGAAAYLGWLAVQQRRLTARIAELEERAAKIQRPPQRAKAA